MDGGGGGGSEYVKLLDVFAEHNREYRIQKVVYRNYLFFVWSLMGANSLPWPLKGVHPCNGCCPHPYHYVPRHKKKQQIP
jgi:hypothetical protein